jgi:hypothetical protein
VIVVERKEIMKKKIKKNVKIDYNGLERIRVYEMKQFIQLLNDDECSISSCELRKYALDVVGR